ncbi:MAG: segregation/condensation protein A [Firmicutes bacterium]|nr:segregation/condensation protein A [Bacillota bacterium]
MGLHVVRKKSLKNLDFQPPAPRSVVLDEKTSAYIEKLRTEPNEFGGPLNIRLDDYEGPLDLLLHLVRLAKINIEDIFISRITDQYLAAMQDLGNADLEKTGEFIEIAAILIEIKSKALLPKAAAEAASEDDSKRELIRRLEEYKLYKEAGEKMKRSETVGIFFKPAGLDADPDIVLRDMTPDGLFDAIQKLFLKIEQRGLTAPAPKKIDLEPFTVAEQMEHIRDCLLLRGEIGFFELFQADYTKIEIIITFLALLELLKMQTVKAVQEDIFSDIRICAVNAE